jgi:hypothetical protein
MTHLATETQTEPQDLRSGGQRRTRWPLVGAAAGVLGVIATLATDLHLGTDGKTDTAAIVDKLSQPTAHASLVAGYATVTLLIVLSALWRRHVESRVPGSTAARVVSSGLISAAGALTLGYGWKGALAVYLPGGMDDELFDQTGLYVYYILNDFGSFIGWLGVTVAAGAVAWMALRERTISRWIGIVSLLPVLAVVAFSGGTGLPGFPGVVSGVWMVVAFLGLGLGKSPISASA